MLSWQMHSKGLQVDLFGQILEVGDTVLTKGYYDVALTEIATITKINKKSIKVNLPHKKCVRNIHTGTYDYVEVQTIKRTGADCVKLTPQQVKLLKEAPDLLKNIHPEYFL